MGIPKLALKSIFLIALFVSCFISIMVVDGVKEIVFRGPIGETTGGREYSWDAQDFSGFYYDIDKNIGNENIGLNILGCNTSPNKIIVVYRTEAQSCNFDYTDWGSYLVIGFLGNPYFAKYNEGSYLHKTSQDNYNLFNQGFLSKILLDIEEYLPLCTGSVLPLSEGYELRILMIDLNGEAALVQLAKEGKIIEEQRIVPEGDTYCYKAHSGNTKNLITIAVHFKDIFRDNEVDRVAIDGIWQISDEPISINSGENYGKMRVEKVDFAAMELEMYNSDNLSLRNGNVLDLAGGFKIKVADQVGNGYGNTNRFCIFREITDPGKYEIRGSVADVKDGRVIWDAKTFAGFYYDLDDNISTEVLEIDIINGDLIEENSIKYTTQTQIENFDFDKWGQYEVIGLLGEKYFAGYKNGYLSDECGQKELPKYVQLSKVLFDTDEEVNLAEGNHLKLRDGYVLIIKEIDLTGNKVWVELKKYGIHVTDRLVDTNSGDYLDGGTLKYMTNIGNIRDILTIAIHFKDAFRGENQSFVSIDGVFQISDRPEFITDVAESRIMEVNESSGDRIVMGNRQRFSLSRHKDIQLIGDIRLKTSDIDGGPNRFYIYREAKIEGQEIGETIFVDENDINLANTQF